MKILFLIASLRGGGAERVAANLCNHWAEIGQEVVLVTLDDASNDFYASNAKIKRYGVKSFKTSRNIIEKVQANVKRIRRIREIVKAENPDVVVSFMDVANMLAILSCAFLKIPVIVSERTYPPYYNDKNMFDYLRKFLYKFATAFVAQTSNVARWAEDFLPQNKISVIANPLDSNAVKSILNVQRENIILAVGRLSHEKGYDLLIEAFSRLSDIYPDWRLRIVGEGKDRAILEAQVARLGLENKVQLPGATSTPQDEYLRAKIFVLCSRVEGFPNVLVEAMAHGMAAVSFDCNCGPADIIQNGINGLLVESGQLDELVNSMRVLMHDHITRDLLGKEASKVKAKYKLENISATWLNLFQRSYL